MSMEHLRTRWAALAVALLLLVSVAGVAGASGLVKTADESAPIVQSQGDDQGDQGEDADEDQDEDSTEAQDTEDQAEDTTEDTTDTEGAHGAQGAHGAIVSDVAQNKDCVGGPNANHGGAVSQVAHGILKSVACPEVVPEAGRERNERTMKPISRNLLLLAMACQIERP